MAEYQLVAISNDTRSAEQKMKDDKLTIKFAEEVRIFPSVKSELVDVEGESLLLTFFDKNDDSKGEINFLLIGYHQQDCCENVFAEFACVSHIDFTAKCEDNVFTGIEFRKVADVGFLIEFMHTEDYYGNMHKYLVPCYNSQNGYYSSELILQVHTGKEFTTTPLLYDLEGALHDDID